MSIKQKAISQIAAQLTALVGTDNFKIVDGESTYGSFTGKPIKPKKIVQKQFNFKDTEVYPRIKALKPGETVTLAPLPGVPVKNLQSVSASVALKAFGEGNSMTSRRTDGSVDVLRLS